MSLFVWNDRRWQLIEENAEYDKENYFIIQKLFVRWLKNCDIKVINEVIRKEFSKFGPVEMVESVVSSASIVKPDIYEAYVLFERSEDAYKAFITNRDVTKSSDEIITVLPADTWKLMPTLENDDELSMLSHRISNIEEDDTQFVYKMFITPGMLLRIFRSFIRLSNEFLTGIDLHYGPEDSSDDESENETDETDEDSMKTPPPNNNVKKDDDSDINCITNQEFEKRIAEVIVKNIGPKFCSFTIQKTSISEEMLQWYAPVLKQLKILKVLTVTDCSVLYALHGYCPNVVSFHLDGEEWTSEFDNVPIQQWPSLKDLYINIIDMDDDEVCEEGNRKFRRFLEVNPQIAAIQVDSILDLDTLSTIGRKMTNLNTIAFVRLNFEGLHLILDNLAGLMNLRGLKLSALEVEKTDLNALIKFAKRFSRLQHLQLITIFLNCEPDTEVGEDFCHLKEFCITHHYNCKCHGPNRTISFTDNNVEVPDDSSVLVLIVNTKPPSDSKDKTLKCDILNVFKKTTKFFPNIIKKIEQPGTDNHLFIQISSRL